MSSLFDDLKDKLSTAKDSAGKIAKNFLDKTTNAVDITKLNLAKGEAEGKISKLFVQIGETVYEKYKNGEISFDFLSESFDEIDKFKSEIEEIKQQLSALKSSSVCPNCGQKNDKSDDFCSKCGTKLPSFDVEEDAEDVEPADDAPANEQKDDGVVDVVSDNE